MYRIDFDEQETKYIWKNIIEVSNWCKEFLDNNETLPLNKRVACVSTPPGRKASLYIKDYNSALMFKLAYGEILKA